MADIPAIVNMMFGIPRLDKQMRRRLAQT